MSILVLELGERQLLPCDVIDALDTLIFCSSSRQYCVFPATVPCEAFDDGLAQMFLFTIFLLLVGFGIFPLPSFPKFPILAPPITMLLEILMLQLFQFLTPSITMLLEFPCLTTFPSSLTVNQPVATLFIVSLFICSATHLLFVTTLIPSTSMYFRSTSRNSAFMLDSVQIAVFSVQHKDHHTSFFELDLDDFHLLLQTCTASQPTRWGESSHAGAWQLSDDCYSSISEV